MREASGYKLMFSEADVLPEGVVRMFRPLYGGDVESLDGRVRLPFVLRKEAVKVDGTGTLLQIVETAVERVQPRCVHFGTCGGCQYQMQQAVAQITDKRNILRGLLADAGVMRPDDIQAVDAFEYEYRNRIRLRIERVDGELRFGYSARGTTQFLPITMCPIAAPLLWHTATMLLDVAKTNIETAQWLDAASEVEFFADDAVAKIQMTLGCAPRTRLSAATFTRMMQAVSKAAPQVVGAGAIAVDPRTGPTRRVLAHWGADGLAYRVADETYWVSRGGFFQVNRFLIGTLVQLVCEGRRGRLAWDLYAGVGLFSRQLARAFEAVTAVEANPGAMRDLRAAFAKMGGQHQAIERSTLAFLQQALVQRERAELIVLDPPRAGAGVEVCELLLRVAAPEMVYVSCDPTTLARDLAVLQNGYAISAMKLVDMFPQTFHMETVVTLQRR